MALSKAAKYGTVAAVAVGVVAIAATVVVTMNSTPAQAPDYQASDCQPGALKVDGAAWGGSVKAVSSSGEYILGDGDSVLWGPDGETTPMLKTVKKGLDRIRTAEPLEVNSQGTVIGTARTKNVKSVGWKYADGEVTELKAPEKYRDQGLTIDSINDDGDIVGHTEAEHGVYLFEWGSDGGEPETLAADKDARISAGVELTDDGSVIAGGQLDKSEDMRLREWSAGGPPRKLPYPGEISRSTGFEIAGDWMLTDEGDRWNIAEEGELDESTLHSALTIDSRGRVFGASDKEEVPAVESDSGVAELPVPDGADAKEFQTTSVGSHSGVIAGTGETKDGDTAMGWRCDDS